MTDPVAPVAVIIAVYNGEAYLGEAIRSVLNQTLPPADILIVDDGSTDGTASVCAQFGSSVRYLRRPHAGVASALNEGIAASSAEWLAFLDADDLWPPGKLARQFDAVARRPDAEMVFGQMRQFRSPEVEGADEPVDESPLTGLSKGTMLIRRAAMVRVGSFVETYRVGEFVDWYLRAQDCGLREIVLDEVLLHRRLHDTNLGRRDTAARSDFARIIKAALDRRRRG